MGFGALEEQYRECTGFLIMPKRPHACGFTWVLSLTMQRWASDLVINLLTSLCSYISVPPTCLAPTASCAANMHNKEGLSADTTNTSVCGDDVLDRDVAHQSHVSAFLSHLPRLPVSHSQVNCVYPPHRRMDVLLQVFVFVFISDALTKSGSVPNGRRKLKGQ